MFRLFSLLLAVLGGWAGFANPIAHLPAMVLLLPAGLALWGVLAPSGRHAFLGGWLGGVATFAGCLYWIALPVHDYGNQPWWLAGLCPVLLGAYLGLYHGLFSLFARFGFQRFSPLGAGLFCGLTWASCEVVRGWAFTGFPWLALPSALAPWPETLAFLSVGGTHVVAGVMAGAASLGALALARRANFRSLLGAGCALAVMAGYGFTPLYSPPAQTSEFTASLVQGNVDQSVKWDPDFIHNTIDRYATLTRGGVAQGATFSVWPETAMPFYMQEVDENSAAVKQVARETGTAILTGAPGYVLNAKDGSYNLFNRAYLVGTNGMDKGTYEKVHLVPFGEYVPLGEYLPFVEKLAEGAGDFVSGNGGEPLQTPAGGANLALGTLICYETIFTELAQNRVEQGANVLVNISNDAWFGRSSAPLQHLHLSVLRAIEQGRWILRGTNTGISAFIDPAGRITAQTRLFRGTALVAEAGTVEQTTVYHAVQTWVVPVLGICWAAMLFGGLASRRSFLKR